AGLVARVPDDEALDRAASFGNQEGRGHLVHETIEQGATIRSKIRLVPPRQGYQVVQPNRSDSPEATPRTRRPVPADDLVFATKSEALVERDRVQVGIEAHGPDSFRAEVLQGRVHHRLPDPLAAKLRSHDDGPEPSDGFVGRRRQDADDAPVRLRRETSV